VSSEICDLRYVICDFSLKFYIQHLCCGISIWAANAMDPDNSLSVMKVVVTTRSLRGLASQASLSYGSV